MSDNCLNDTPLLSPSQSQGFSFPFETPYEIQMDFMKALYSAIDGRKLGIFESPTGTGKSLSILCSSLTWLLHHQEQRVKDLKTFIHDFKISSEESKVNSSKDWINAHHELRRKKELFLKCQRELQFLEKIKEKRTLQLNFKPSLSTPTHFFTSSKPTKSQNLQSSTSKISQNSSSRAKNSQNCTLKTEKSQNCTSKTKNCQNSSSKTEISSSFKLKLEDASDELLLNDEFAPIINLENVDESDFEEEENENEGEFNGTKIIFSSRTHSQLAQFLTEFKRTNFSKKIRVATLGSRGALCINSEVRKLKNISLINERCIDLQKSSKGKKTTSSGEKKQKTCSGCPYFNRKNIEELKKQILSTPLDIEELVEVGKKTESCPYYASRKAGVESDLILAPYNTILHESTRETIGINVKNAVVIVDEAHNLIPTLSSLYSSSIDAKGLEEAQKGLGVYIERFRTRFSDANLLKLEELQKLIQGLTKILEIPIEKAYFVREFMSAANIDSIDTYGIIKYIEKSKLLFKLKGYLLLYEKYKEIEREALKEIKTNENFSKNEKSKKGEKIEENNGENVNKNGVGGQSLLNFYEFLKSITFTCGSGRIIQSSESKMLKFLLLNTSDHFSKIIGVARSVILAGGTMRPYEDIETQLFNNSRDRIFHFSCCHVIPTSNLACFSLSYGPSSKLFDFTFKNRNSPSLMQELSQTILNISRIVPGGLVIFLPSYEYEATFYAHLLSSGMIQKIQTKKRLFREKRDEKSDEVLSAYSLEIRNNSNGAILLGVVGGKLSEGINFSDELGRCVIVVGLPYPNITSVETKEKIAHISQNYGAERGRDYLNNACFKAVNQTIGRCIRHSADFATIILIDCRYSKSESVSQLPLWIQKSYVHPTHFGKCLKGISTFFNNKKNIHTVLALENQNSTDY